MSGAGFASPSTARRGQRPGQRGRPRVGAAVGAGRARHRLLRAARGRCRDRDPAQHGRRLRARAEDHAEPLRRRHRGEDRRAAGRDARSPTRRPTSASEINTRAQLEHAIAVLVGKPPGDFSTRRRRRGRRACRRVPPGVPSTLLQRRPDIASAERAVAAANAQIGIAARGLLPRLFAERLGRLRRLARADLFSASSSAVVARPVGGADDLRRRRDRRPRRRRRSGARCGGRPLPPDRAERVPERRGPAQRERVAEPAGGPAAQGLGGRRPDRAAAAEPLSRRPGRRTPTSSRRRRRRSVRGAASCRSRAAGRRARSP